MRSFYFTLMLFNGFITLNFAQDSTQHRLTLGAYVDGYLSAYSNDLSQQQFQPFITAGARDNTFGVNIAETSLSYEHADVRGKVILHWGDIPQATWSGDFNQIQEANAGIKITKGLWFDAGFFATHIGTESFLPKNNFLSSTAFKTFNEPFYQAGAKLSYTYQDWYFELWALNGYNLFVDTNDAKSVGALVQYNLNASTSITYTNIYGRENDDDINPDQNRFYQNIYLTKNWENRFFVVLGLDVGLQSNSSLEVNTDTAFMSAGLATFRYAWLPKWSMTLRGEWFDDPDGFIGGIITDTEGQETGVRLYGITLGTEYKPIKNSYFRLEGRYTTAADEQKIFLENGDFTKERWELLITLGIDFEKVFKF